MVFFEFYLPPGGLGDLESSSCQFIIALRWCRSTVGREDITVRRSTAQEVDKSNNVELRINPPFGFNL